MDFCESDERQTRSQAIFVNPFLRVLAVFLLVLLVIREGTGSTVGGGDALSLTILVALIIGATVAGADFILLLVAIFKNNDNYIDKHFQLEQARLSSSEAAARQVAEAIQEKHGRTGNRRALRDRFERIPSGTRVLWVDDVPSRNYREIRALQRADVEVTITKTNEDAAAAFGAGEFDAVISDIHRGDRALATEGLRLPAALEEAGGRRPTVIFYVHAAEKRMTDDGDPIVDDPETLFEVLEAAVE